MVLNLFDPMNPFEDLADMFWTPNSSRKPFVETNLSRAINYLFSGQKTVEDCFFLDTNFSKNLLHMFGWQPLIPGKITKNFEERM